MGEIGYAPVGSRRQLTSVAMGFPPGSLAGFIRAPLRAGEGFKNPGELVFGYWAPLRAVEAARFARAVVIKWKFEHRLARILYAREGASEAWRAAYQLGGIRALEDLARALLAESEVGDGLGAP